MSIIDNFLKLKHKEPLNKVAFVNLAQHAHEKFW